MSSSFLRSYSVTDEDQIKRIISTEDKIKQFQKAKYDLHQYSQSVDKLFNHVVATVQKFNEFKTKENLFFIEKLVPLPSDEVKSRYGLKLGYIKSVIHFFSHAAQHFVKLTIQGHKTNSRLNERLQELAKEDLSFTILGQLTTVDLDQV